MELVDGVTLRAWMEREHPRGEVLEALVDAGRGLAAAHAKGLVHRDFKPDYTRGAPKILQHPAARGFVAPGRVFGASHVSVAAA
jgi:hypothetical protein